MTATPSDPLATQRQHSGSQYQAPADASACSRKTAPCANCWPPRSARSCPSARRGPAPGVVVDQRAPGAALVRWRSLAAARRPPSPASAWAGTRRALHPGDLRRAGAAGRVLEHAQFCAHRRVGRQPRAAAAAAAALPGLGQGMPMPRRTATHRRRGRPAHVPHTPSRLKRPRGIPSHGTGTFHGHASASPVPAPVPTLRITRNPRRTARQLDLH